MTEDDYPRSSLRLSRRAFVQSAVASATGLGAACLFGGDVSRSDRPRMKPVHGAIVCPWTPQHPRHDHQLMFPLDDERLLLVWSEYYSKSGRPATRKGHTGARDSVSCRIASMGSGWSAGLRRWI